MSTPFKLAITGGASGLGRALALMARARGAAVFVGDADEAALAALADDHPGIGVEPCRLGESGAAERFIAAAARHLSGLDGLVNNVGVAGPVAALGADAAEAWELTFDVNVFAAVRAMRVALPLLRASGRGAVVNVTTASTMTNPARRSSYVGSKAALEAVTRVFAREAAGEGVRANCVAPGPMDNARLRRVVGEIAATRGVSSEDLIAEATRGLALGRLIEMEEVAEAIWFLLSPAASAITGQCLAVDGMSLYED